MATTINPPFQVNPQPKARFLAEGADVIKAHRDLMQNQNLKLAIDVALLQYQGQLSNAKPPDAASAAFSFYKVTGALEYINVLKNLAETPPAAPAKTSTDNLAE